ncbi:MAG: energy-coupling factor ABC transporter permease, partial [Planctomycetia bacterium]
MITSPILALHMPDGLIEGHWLALGWVCAGLLAWFGTRRLADSDIPKIALLCAVFFITSIIPIQIPGGPRAHLLLNGLIGIILGRQCVLAFAPALFLQAVLFSHGGFLTLGLNLCVMSLPALLSRQLFVGLLRLGETFPRWLLFVAEMLAHFATL